MFRKEAVKEDHVQAETEDRTGLQGDQDRKAVMAAGASAVRMAGTEIPMRQGTAVTAEMARDRPTTALTGMKGKAAPDAETAEKMPPLMKLH